MKQTAVEWLVENLIIKPNWVQVKIIEQAKEMEKEQIIQAAQYEPFLGDLPRTEGEHYFEKTFKK